MNIRSESAGRENRSTSSKNILVQLCKRARFGRSPNATEHVTAVGTSDDNFFLLCKVATGLMHGWNKEEAETILLGMQLAITKTFSGAGVQQLA